MFSGGVCQLDKHVHYAITRLVDARHRELLPQYMPEEGVKCPRTLTGLKKKKKKKEKRTGYY